MEKNIMEQVKGVIANYIAAQEVEKHEKLLTLYRCMQEVLPQAQERISWAMPTFWQGKNIIHFACFKKHMGIYPGAEAVEVFQEQIQALGLKSSKGAIQIPFTMDLPIAFIQEISIWCFKKYGK